MKKFEDGYWINIFAHYPLNNLRFDSYEKFLHSDDSRLFSRLSDINSKFKINGKYIFMLQYPVGIVKWEQSNNPLDEEENESKTSVEGFKLHEHPPTIQSNRFGGLAKTKREQCGCINTYLKGHFIDQNWWYAIGQMPGCCHNWQGNLTAGPLVGVDSVHLWIKINPNLINKKICTFKSFNLFCISKNVFTSIFIITS